MINALRFTEALEKAGFTSEQAIKSVDIWMSLINENLATKSDMREMHLLNKSDLRDLHNEQKIMKIDLQNQMKDMRTDLETQIKELRTDLETQIKELRTDLETQIKDLDKKIDTQSTRIIFQLGGLMIALFTISTAIISLLITK